jgi:hypothetical protein
VDEKIIQQVSTFKHLSYEMKIKVKKGTTTPVTGCEGRL